KILFSTHFHELTDLERLPGAVNYTVAVREEQDGIVFLRRVIPGKADRSYGIQVASLAGLPDEVIARAKEILRHLELRRRRPVPAGQQLQLFSPQAAEAHPVLREMRALDLGTVTPIEALNRLYEWQSRLREGERG
ncbi:MAG: DNA mismatch repair protein MutS, partial [Firmicutes bacterium]|nr:DNA mismatch repair protein MutS [Bacillota bacterium]